MSESPRLTRRAMLGAAIGSTSLAGISRQAFAQSGYPTKAIRLIVGFGTGSVNDQVARHLAPIMGEMLGQSVLVDNRTGAGGSLGTDLVAKAAPDGYTIGLGTSSQLVMNVGLYKNLPFDVDRDLRSIALISSTPLVLVARNGMPTSLKAVIAQAKANPGKVTYGSAGTGSTTHVVGEAFARAAGVQLLHVPYKGNAAALMDLAGGHVDLLFDSFLSSGPQAKQGRLHILAFSGAKRSPMDPRVATFTELGLKDFEASSWNCLFVPANTPAAIVAKLNAALNKAMMAQGVLDHLAQGASMPLAPSTPEQAEAYGRAQREKWVPFVRALKIDMS